MADDSSDLSELSSVPSEDESGLQLTKKNGILKFFTKTKGPIPKPSPVESPPRPKRDPSPPHEYVLADNPDIAFIVMFRARFTEAFPKSLAHFGPQELERDVVDTVPGEGAEHFLCALLGLLLNRKQDVKAGHYNRALEEALQTHKSQWAKDWESQNPLAGGATFSTMSPTARLTLLRTLVLWTLSSSDVVKGMVTTSYKQNRHDDDLNQQLSVQPWGSDGDRRRYYLIEGLDDTHFRVYRESNHLSIKRTWWSVASDIDELRHLADKLQTEDGGQKARLLSGKMVAAIPRFEATEEKRKRREYRQTRKQQFKRPELGFSLYEGRTRGKRMKYTYSDDEDYGEYSDDTNRRSSRNTGTNTPAEGSTAPTVTLSGRQVKLRQGGTYGESVLSGVKPPTHVEIPDDTEHSETGNGRPRRAAANKATSSYTQKDGRKANSYNSFDELEDDDDDDASEQDYGDDEEEDEAVQESEEDVVDETTEPEDEEMLDLNDKRSLMVKLTVKTPTPEKISKTQDLHDETEHNTGSALSKTGGQSRLSDADPAKAIKIRETTPPLSEKPSTPINIQIKSPAIPAAQSPSLAFRGSPEKPPAFQPSINVG